MGLFSRKPRDGVRGVAQVVSSTAHGGEATHQTCRLHLVVQVDGMPAYSVEHKQICPASKWPHPGTTLPVIVSRKDPQKLKIDFDAVPKASDVARQQADQQAAWLRGERPARTPVPGAALAPPGALGSPQVTIVGGTADDIPPEMRANLEQMLGVDIDGDGLIGNCGSAAPGAGRDDRLVHLERLARLRDSGALTPAEFETEKRRLLGG